MPFADAEKARNYQREYRRTRRAGDARTTPGTSQLPVAFRLQTAQDVIDLLQEQVALVRASELDATVCERAAPGADVLALATREAAAFGFTEAQARAFLAREGERGPDALLTASAVDARVREAFDSLVQQWA
jgi:hypothetical protein